jgi:N-methylhydantoinase A
VLRIVNANMAGAVRLVSTTRGIDPAGFTLIAYGGGGPLHAASVAQELGLRRVLVPWSPGLASAFGLLVADTVLDVAQSELHALSDKTLDDARLTALLERAAETARACGLDPHTCETQLTVDMRYVGQAFELGVPVPVHVQDAVTLRELFEAEHQQRYGYSRASLEVEVVGYRLRILSESKGELHPPLPDGTGGPFEHHEIVLEGQRLTAAFLPRSALACGAQIDGPAVLEEPTSTTLIPLGWRGTCLPTGDLMLEAMT